MAVLYLHRQNQCTDVDIPWSLTPKSITHAFSFGSNTHRSWYLVVQSESNVKESLRSVESSIFLHYSYIHGAKAQQTNKIYTSHLSHEHTRGRFFLGGGRGLRIWYWFYDFRRLWTSHLDQFLCILLSLEAKRKLNMVKRRHKMWQSTPLIRGKPRWSDNLSSR